VTKDKKRKLIGKECVVPTRLMRDERQMKNVKNNVKK
jgi:hypothetical protein